MRKGRLKYFSFDKINYLYDNMEDPMLPMPDESILDPELKIAG